MVYMPPSKYEFDTGASLCDGRVGRVSFTPTNSTVYPAFGGANWTWDNFVAFSKQAERFTAASAQFRSATYGATQDGSQLGKDGVSDICESLNMD